MANGYRILSNVCDAGSRVTLLRVQITLPSNAARDGTLGGNGIAAVRWDKAVQLPSSFYRRGSRQGRDRKPQLEGPKGAVGTG